MAVVKRRENHRITAESSDRAGRQVTEMRPLRDLPARLRGAFVLWARCDGFARSHVKGLTEGVTKFLRFYRDRL
jgi:hypothetical protein